MKNFISGLFFLVFAGSVSAQEMPLQFDESNKYVYYRIVDAPGTPADSLYRRGWDFAKKLSAKNTPVKGKAALALNTKANFLIYTGSSIIKKEAGAVNYTLNIEARENKYRYKLSDFVFIPYKRDRFNNMVAQPGIEVPAEKLLAKYPVKEANILLAQIVAFCKSTGDELNVKMQKITVAAKPAPPKKIATENW